MRRYVEKQEGNLIANLINLSSHYDPPPIPNLITLLSGHRFYQCDEQTNIDLIVKIDGPS